MGRVVGEPSGSDTRTLDGLRQCAEHDHAPHNTLNLLEREGMSCVRSQYSSLMRSIFVMWMALPLLMLIVGAVVTWVLGEHVGTSPAEGLAVTVIMWAGITTIWWVVASVMDALHAGLDDEQDEW